MTDTFNIAIIGDSETAINAVRVLVDEYYASDPMLPSLDIMLFGNYPEDSGNPAWLHQYKGQAGIDVTYRQAVVTDLTRETDGSYRVISDGVITGSFERVVLAIEDALAFKDASLCYPDEIFQSSDQAFDVVLRDNGHGKVVVAYGTDSALADLSQNLSERGFQGKVIGISLSEASLTADHVCRNINDGHLVVGPVGGKYIDADYFIDCMSGPASAEEMVMANDLLGNLCKKEWLKPRASGFEVNNTHAIDLLGSMTGQDSEAKTATWARNVIEKLEMKSPGIRFRRRDREFPCG